MRKSRWFSLLYIWLVMAFLYAPIAVLIIFSFNDSKSRNTGPALPCAGMRNCSTTGSSCSPFW